MPLLLLLLLLAVEPRQVIVAAAMLFSFCAPLPSIPPLLCATSCCSCACLMLLASTIRCVLQEMAEREVLRAAASGNVWCCSCHPEHVRPMLQVRKAVQHRGVQGWLCCAVLCCAVLCCAGCRACVGLQVGLPAGGVFWCWETAQVVMKLRWAELS